MPSDPLSRLITQAMALPGRYDRLLEQLLPPMIGWDDFPEVTFHKLEGLGRLELLSGLRLLRDPFTSYGAEVHERTLLEMMAHVAWVAGADEFPAKPTEGRRRALCWELGLARESQSLSAIIPDQHHYDGKSARLEADRRQRALHRLHKREGCPCRGRSWSDAKGTLAAMADIGDAVHQAQGRQGTSAFRTYTYLRRTASAMAHLGLGDRVFQKVAPGVTAAAPASHEHRAALLSWLTHTYGSAALFMLERHSPAHAKRMLHAVDRVLSAETMRQAQAGQYG